MTKAAEHLVDMRKFVSRLQSFRPDVIHFQWLPVPLLDSLYLQELGTIAPLVLTVHNTSPHGTSVQRLYQKFRWSSIFRHFRAIIVHSQFSKQQIVEKSWAPADRIHVVPHAALDYYLSLDGSKPFAESLTPLVMFFGNIEPYKGLDVLIRAFALLPTDLLACSQLLVVGSPNVDIRPLQRLSRDVGIETQVVWKLGFVSEESVPQLFRAATVVVLPYRSIDQSGVLMTAIAFGKAIIASRTGGFPEIIEDGVQGLLTEPGDVQELSTALRRLLTDPGRRHSLGKAASHLARTELSWTQSAIKTIAVYEKVLAEQ